MAGTRIGGLKAAKKCKELYGDDFYQQAGYIGGKKHSGKETAMTNKERYGDDYYSRIGKVGGLRSKRKKSFIQKVIDIF